MSSVKTLLVILILISILFVIFLVGGLGKGEPNNDPKAGAKDFNSQPHPTWKSLNGILAPFGPKLKARELQPSLAVFDLQAGPHYSVRILPDSDHKFRQAKFTVRPSKACMRISYEALGSVPDHMSKTQSLPDPDDDKTSNEFTLTIFSGGGTLTVDRSSPYASLPCKISLQ